MVGLFSETFINYKFHFYMIYCGLKLTHDSTVAIFEDNKLIASIELEKINNNNRYKIIDDNCMIQNIVGLIGYQLSDIDKFIVDGWYNKENLPAKIKVYNEFEEQYLSVAAYHESYRNDNLLSKLSFSGLKIGSKSFNYQSYSHASGHVFSSYCTSEFARRKENSFILVWDGGMYPRLYYFLAKNKKVINLGELFYFGTNIYSIFLQGYGPFKINENVTKDELSIAGKIMAYVAYGREDQTIINMFRKAYLDTFESAKDPHYIPEYPYIFSRRFKQITRDLNFYEEDIITSFHYFIQQLLLSSLQQVVSKSNLESENLCMSGGAALNIKWNSAIRNSVIFKNVWVPPFPNDSGSALGAVCCELVGEHDTLAIDWNVYRGPALIKAVDVPHGFLTRECVAGELAKILYEKEEPVVLLQGNAEIGPRSLGNRSILAPATTNGMKDTLNRIKYREDYRPIAPICLADKSSEYFYPGGRDPFMLFDHRIKDQWIATFPALRHQDGTVRLQTLSTEENPFIYDLLSKYYHLSGHPILCNTSANFKGCGFFCDVSSAIRWNKVNYIWSDGVLYFRDPVSPVSFSNGTKWQADNLTVR